jgi:hypothetical protein
MRKQMVDAFKKIKYFNYFLLVAAATVILVGKVVTAAESPS